MNVEFIGEFVIEGGRRCRMVHYRKQLYFQRCNSVEAEGVHRDNAGAEAYADA